MYDLINDPGELENLGDKTHPKYNPAMVDRLLKKLHKLAREEVGEDKVPFHLDRFGTREVKYRTEKVGAVAAD